jgi:hypothetical protein
MSTFDSTFSLITILLMKKTWFCCNAFVFMHVLKIKVFLPWRHQFYLDWLIFLTQGKLRETIVEQCLFNNKLLKSVKNYTNMDPL